MKKVLFITTIIFPFIFSDAFSQLKSDLDALTDTIEVHHSQLVQSLLYSRHTQLNTMDRITVQSIPALKSDSPVNRTFTSRLALNLTRDLLDNRFGNEQFRNFRPSSVSEYNRIILNENYSPYSRHNFFNNRWSGIQLPGLDN